MAYQKKSEFHEEKIARKGLLKKPQTLQEIADRLGMKMKQLTLPMSNMVRDGRAIKHEGETKSDSPRYSKPKS